MWLRKYQKNKLLYYHLTIFSVGHITKSIKNPTVSLKRTFIIQVYLMKKEVFHKKYFFNKHLKFLVNSNINILDTHINLLFFPLQNLNSIFIKLLLHF